MPQIGDVIAGKYRLEKVAGEGGMGIVYAAEHLVLSQRVAVKVLLPDSVTSDAVVERFSREARAAAKISSEHVARVLDAGSLSSGAPFLVMEFLEGCDLEELVELQRTLPILEVVDYLLQALDGLAHAHAVGIVHRDLKPANLFLAIRPDGTNAIKLLDFGISKSTKGRPDEKRLTGQHVLGSPVYMSPEQLRNATDIDPRADIWSVGVLAYELLAGHPPFDGDGVGEIFAAILEKSPIPLSEVSPSIPEGLSAIVTKCLRRDPAERWQDAGALARALAPFGSDPQSPIVERAEQVLLRAKRMDVPKTPLETRRVVEAIEAAAERARTSTTSTGAPVLALARRKKDHATFADGVSTRALAFARRSPLQTGLGALTMATLLGVAVFGAVRATRASTAASRAAVSTREVTPVLAGTAPAAETAEPPVILELPTGPDHAAPRRGVPRGASSTKPQRPKFLNSRE